MTPAEMAAIHASAMTVPAPWSVRDFETLAAGRNVFIASPSASGFALGRVVVDEAELLTLAVDPDAQRQGIGRACLTAFETEAIARGANHLHLEVAATNAPALSLYRSAGWHEAGRRKAYYKGPDARIDAILMTKQLARD